MKVEKSLKNASSQKTLFLKSLSDQNTGVFYITDMHRFLILDKQTQLISIFDVKIDLPP